MQRSRSSTWGALVGLGALLASVQAGAQTVVVAELETSPNDGVHAMVPMSVKLSTQKPEFVTKEPTYRVAPRYGSIELGDARNNQIAVALDGGGSGSVSPRLYVDGNGNGDLTDDAPVRWRPLPAPTVVSGEEQEGEASSKPQSASGERLGAVVPVIARYSIVGRAGTVQSSLQFIYWDGELAYNREYSRVGKLTVGGKSYRVALVDQTLNARFNDFKHDPEEPARVTLLVDKDGDGRFDPRRESYDAAKPIRLGGMRFVVNKIDVRGTTIALAKADKREVESVSAKDLAVGNKVIPFEADTMDGRAVMFPQDFKKKIVLLDFWAVWCGPCVREVPNIVQVYNKYHAQGFDILGISLDQENQSERVSKFTRQHQMKWDQVYDGGYWKAEIAVLYGINAIPQAYLVDGTTGKILAMGDEIRGEGLARAVEAALSGKKR